MKSFGFYRECAGEMKSGSERMVCAGGFPIKPLARSRWYGLWGLVFGVLSTVLLTERDLNGVRNGSVLTASQNMVPEEVGSCLFGSRNEGRAHTSPVSANAERGSTL